MKNKKGNKVIMNESERALREDLGNLRAKAEFLQEIWDMREKIASDPVVRAKLIAEDNEGVGWSAYTTAAEMLVEETFRRYKLSPERTASMVTSLAQTLKENCEYMEVVKDYVMTILKTYLLRAEATMRANGWELPEWKRCPWLDEVTGSEQ